LQELTNIDFSDKFFQSSGIGRSRIRNTILIKSGLLDISKIQKKDFQFYSKIVENVVVPDVERNMWEEDAEESVNNVLESAEWNFESKSVNLYVNGDFENAQTIKDYKSFFYRLVEIATMNFVSSLPSKDEDNTFADNQINNFDFEDLIHSILENYKANLLQLGWYDLQ